jgi:hypothetical protein
VLALFYFCVGLFTVFGNEYDLQKMKYNLEREAEPGDK